MKKKGLELDKFRVAKLNNMHLIVGGDPVGPGQGGGDGDGDGTKTFVRYTYNCVLESTSQEWVPK